jgi:hypothetical protein
MGMKGGEAGVGGEVRWQELGNKAGVQVLLRADGDTSRLLSQFHTARQRDALSSEISE